jgi:hypothetical protein
MATYNELFELHTQNTDLLNRVTVAKTIKAQALLALPTPTAAQVAWAVDSLGSSREASKDLLSYVLAANAGLTVAQITNATDAAIQSAVNAAVDKIIAAGA